MTVTLNSLTLDVEEMVYGVAQVERPPEDTLKTAVTASNDVSWQFDTASYWKRGTIGEYLAASGAEGECIILAADYTLASDVTVRRAQLRTTAAASYAIGDVFRVNPTYPRVKVRRYIGEIVDSLAPDIWIRTSRSVDINQGRYYYPLNQYDYEIENVWQADTDYTSLGAATYDETGGTIEDEWTLNSHGLAVGDTVRFTAVGTGATGYAVNTVYWVAAVPNANEFSLSATEGGSAIAGTGDSVGTWTLEKINTFRFDPLPPDAWEVITGVDSRTSSTNRILRIATYYDDASTLYYQAKTKPNQADYTNIPDQVGDLISYGAAWLTLGGTRVIPPRIDPLRGMPANIQPNQLAVDARFFRDEYERRKAEYKRQLDADKYPTRYLRRNEVVRR